MLSNPATITQQQARLLLPLLQQIANINSGNPGPSCETSPSGSCSLSGSSNSSPVFYPTLTRATAAGSGQVNGYSTDENDACKYSSDELFQPKKKKVNLPLLTAIAM